MWGLALLWTSWWVVELTFLCMHVDIQWSQHCLLKHLFFLHSVVLGQGLGSLCCVPCPHLGPPSKSDLRGCRATGGRSPPFSSSRLTTQLGGMWGREPPWRWPWGSKWYRGRGGPCSHRVLLWWRRVVMLGHKRWLLIPVVSRCTPGPPSPDLGAVGVLGEGLW